MSISRAVLALGFFLLLALLLSLGQWQLRRGAEKTSLFDQIGTAESLPALTMPVESQRLEEYRYRWLNLRGRYDSSRQLLLDSMTYGGRAGYQVLTPFLPQDSRRWLLINRGWVIADPDRRVLPEVAVSDEIRDVRGRISSLPRPGLQLRAVAAEDAVSWPQVVFFPAMDELERRLGEPLYGYQMWLDSSSPDGFMRAWSPVVLSPEQHVGYAIQWFALAGALVVMSVVVSVSSARRDRN